MSVQQTVTGCDHPVEEPPVIVESVTSSVTVWTELPLEGQGPHSSTSRQERDSESAAGDQAQHPVNHWPLFTRECESSEGEKAGCGHNPDGCGWCPDSLTSKQRIQRAGENPPNAGRR